MFCRRVATQLVLANANVQFASDAAKSSGLQLPNQGQTVQQDLRGLAWRVQKLEDSFPTPNRKLPDARQDVLASTCGLQDLQTSLNKTRLSKWGHHLTNREVWSVMVRFDGSCC